MCVLLTSGHYRSFRGNHNFDTNDLSVVCVFVSGRLWRVVVEDDEGRRWRISK